MIWTPELPSYVADQLQRLFVAKVEAVPFVQLGPMQISRMSITLFHAGNPAAWDCREIACDNSQAGSLVCEI